MVDMKKNGTVVQSGTNLLHQDGSMWVVWAIYLSQVPGSNRREVHVVAKQRHKDNRHIFTLEQFDRYFPTSVQTVE
jgi:hypothetical protein